jgi:two-component system response regulator FixJ
VIDDDDAVRDSLEFLLRSARIDVIAHESAAAFLHAIPETGLGCIVTDVRMPEVSGLDLLRRLRDMKRDVPVIVITGHGDVPLAVEAMKAGAADFIEKPFDENTLLRAVRAALDRHQADGKRQGERSGIDAKLAKLSGREREVLEGLVAGHSNKVIAHNLGISPRTVEIYRANVMTKMEAPSLSDLVRMALISDVLPRD